MTSIEMQRLNILDTGYSKAVRRHFVKAHIKADTYASCRGIAGLGLNNSVIKVCRTDATIKRSQQQR
ncbi:hypothetical protein [Hyphomicrobium sp. D-2]|uniref:hypothetical protein n=1 Tax=Hyphomicrobium sp. D-2 TaxID=3041621 RepID=UPI00245459ED|nr:hypothetical protein [Hyphomicrobium sp. D-2]MDH4982878.1 hypothetical protein [Hyphomicrobium sp. D-2]